MGIFVEGEIEAEDESEAIQSFWEYVSYKDCYAEKINEEKGGGEKK